jgi:hypothetical protein
MTDVAWTAIANGNVRDVLLGQTISSLAAML